MFKTNNYNCHISQNKYFMHDDKAEEKTQLPNYLFHRRARNYHILIIITRMRTFSVIIIQPIGVAMVRRTA